MNDPTDMLADRSRRGDRTAFEMLVRQTARGVYAHLLLKTSDPHRSDDLTQETYLLAWKRIGTLRDAKTFVGWLHTIADAALIDSARRGTRIKRVARALHEEPAGPPADLSAENREEQTRALTALRELPETYRLPLTLRYLNDANYETIAKQLAISNGSLRGLLQRGMTLLRERLGVVIESGKVSDPAP